MRLENNKHAISLFIAAYNFCKVHSTLGCTPAVGLKLATEMGLTAVIEKVLIEHGVKLHPSRTTRKYLAVAD
jgi:hypothetical protein